MGYRIKELRKKAGLTQAELSKKSGVNRVTLSSIETGKANYTNTRTLEKIASALDTTVDKLFFEQTA